MKNGFFEKMSKIAESIKSGGRVPIVRSGMMQIREVEDSSIPTFIEYKMKAKDFQIGDKARITKGEHRGKLGEVCIRHFKTDEVTFVEYPACPEIRVKAEFLMKV